MELWRWIQLQSVQNPTHLYSQAGLYTVTLTVSNEQGISQVAKKNYIKVQEPRIRGVKGSGK